jgi:hypothetical protein
MLKRACICIATLSFLVVMGLPIAQARTGRAVKARIPFDFYLRDRVLPAGEYQVSEITDDGALLVRSADGREQSLTQTRNTSATARQAGDSRLVFNRYGDQYFLAAAWMQGGQGHVLVKSHRERSLRNELAQNGRPVAPAAVTVVAEIAAH